MPFAGQSTLSSVRRDVRLLSELYPTSNKGEIGRIYISILRGMINKNTIQQFRQIFAFRETGEELERTGHSRTKHENDFIGRHPLVTEKSDSETHVQDIFFSRLKRTTEAKKSNVGGPESQTA